MDINNLINKLAKEQDDFLRSHFLSPVLRERPIRVRISGIIRSFTIRPKNFEGWGVFRPQNMKEARYVREPNMGEKREYLALFPTLRFVLCRQNGPIWFGLPSNQSDTRFKITGMVPIYLAEEVQLFDTVCSRFDGGVCWFDELDPRRSPQTAIYLRECLTKLDKVDKVSMPGLTQEEKDAYGIAWEVAYSASEEAQKNRETERIRTALSRAGASYTSHIDRGDTYTIEYTVDGDRHRSVVQKQNLSIVSAGICLSGGDQNFDLQSLVGVIREGHNRHRIVRVGLNRDYGYGYQGPPPHPEDEPVREADDYRPDYEDDDW